jgi:hypothetical protein
MPKIIDVIFHKWKYGVQQFVVLDRMPEFRYRRIGSDVLFAQDENCYSAYKHEAPGPTWKAFGGRKFTIEMEEGEPLQAYGQWWDTSPAKYSDEPLIGLGINTIADLQRCYVFTSGHFSLGDYDAWLECNQVSDELHKYDPRHVIYNPDWQVER